MWRPGIEGRGRQASQHSRVWLENRFSLKQRSMLRRMSSEAGDQNKPGTSTDNSAPELDEAVRFILPTASPSSPHHWLIVAHYDIGRPGTWNRRGRENPETSSVLIFEEYLGNLWLCLDRSSDLEIMMGSINVDDNDGKRAPRPIFLSEANLSLITELSYTGSIWGRTAAENNSDIPTRYSPTASLGKREIKTK